MIQIGIVEPNEIMRKGVAHLIDLAGGIRVMGHASAIDALLEQVENTRLDVLVLEPAVAGELNFAVIQLIRRKREALAVLICNFFFR